MLITNSTVFVIKELSPTRMMLSIFLTFVLALFLLPCEQAVASDDEGPYIETPYIIGDGDPPPLSIMVRGESELLEMLDMVLAPDDELVEYLERKGHAHNEVETREELLEFLQLANSIPLPVLPQVEFKSVTRSISSYGTEIRYYLSSKEDDESYSFQHNSKWSHAAEDIEKETGKKAVPLYQTDRIQVYKSAYDYDLDPKVKSIDFDADFDGCSLWGSYRNDHLENMPELLPEQYFEGITISSLSEQYPHEAWTTILGAGYQDPEGSSQSSSASSSPLKNPFVWVASVGVLAALGLFAFFAVRKRNKKAA
jgi:hypothetical protein